MKDPMRLLGDRILVKPFPIKTVTDAGVIIPPNSREMPRIGNVVLTGPGLKDQELVVQVGDTVMFGRFAGVEIEKDKERYLIMREPDITAIM